MSSLDSFCMVFVEFVGCGPVHIHCLIGHRTNPNIVSVRTNLSGPLYPSLSRAWWRPTPSDSESRLPGRLFLIHEGRVDPTRDECHNQNVLDRLA